MHMYMHMHMCIHVFMHVHTYNTPAGHPLQELYADTAAAAKWP